MQHSPRAYLEFLRPRRNALSTPLESHKTILPCIVCLLLARRPLAIIFRVAQVIINAIQRKTFWTRPHVLKKGFKPLPFFINSDTSSAVVPVVGILGIVAPLAHVNPSLIGAGRFTSGAMSVFRPVNYPRSVGPLVFCGATITAKLGVLSVWMWLKRSSAKLAFKCYSLTSHDLNLRHRLGLWSGSFSVRSAVRAACILALLLCFVAPINAQQETEVQKLQRLLGQALDRITDLQKQLETVPPLIEAMKQEREAAANERAAAQRERESLNRAIGHADKAIAAQQMTIDVYEKKLIPAYDKLVDKQAARVDKLEERLDKANRRTGFAAIIGFVAGVAAKIF